MHKSLNWYPDVQVMFYQELKPWFATSVFLSNCIYLCWGPQDMFIGSIPFGSSDLEFNIEIILGMTWRQYTLMKVWEMQNENSWN